MRNVTFSEINKLDIENIESFFDKTHKIPNFLNQI